MSLHLLLLRIGAIVIALAIGPATAQSLPPHYPGTICVTPDWYWCWIPQTPVGSYCTCPSPYGPVAGTVA
jgi:hypothetical protein